MDYEEFDKIQEAFSLLAITIKHRQDYVNMLNRRKGPGEPETKHFPLADADIQKTVSSLGPLVRSALLEPLALAEAGQPLPPFIRDNIESLYALGPMLSYDERASRIWQNTAGQILDRLAPYMAQESPKIAKIEEPRAPLCIPTTKSREELARIFNELVKCGYIAGSTPEALPDFLNAFTTQGGPSPKKQGRITWVWTARNGQESPLQMLDFATQVAGRDRERIKVAGDKVFLAAVSKIFGAKISSGVLDRFKKDIGPDTAFDIARIIDG